MSTELKTDSEKIEALFLELNELKEHYIRIEDYESAAKIRDLSTKFTGDGWKKCQPVLVRLSEAEFQIRIKEADCALLRLALEEIARIAGTSGKEGEHLVEYDTAWCKSRAKRSLPSRSDSLVDLVKIVEEVVSIDHLRDGSQFEVPKKAGQASWVWRICHYSNELKKALSRLGSHWKKRE